MAARGDQWLSATDASNVTIDAADQVNAFLLAGVLGEGGFVGRAGLDLEAVRAALRARLADPRRQGLARLSQRVAGQGRRPVWERCEPDLTWHVRLSEPVEGRAGLAALAATLMTVPMALDRPGWELLVVSGAAERGVGIIFRMHHAVADGVRAVSLVQELFADERGPGLGGSDTGAAERAGERTAARPASPGGRSRTSERSGSTGPSWRSVAWSLAVSLS